MLLIASHDENVLFFSLGVTENFIPKLQQISAQKKWVQTGRSQLLVCTLPVDRVGSIFLSVSLINTRQIDKRGGFC